MPAPLLANLRRRADDRAAGRDSPFRTALVVQGGGMRGIYSMGVLKALGDAGLRPGFDHVFGSSAGAVNGAYFVAGQEQAALDGYIEDLSRKDFINPLRLRRILDVDFMVDEVVKRRRRLDLDRLRAARTRLHVSLTDARDGTLRVVTADEPGVDLYEAFRATSALPILYGRSIRVGTSEYMDGGITDYVPLVTALEAGCTDILVVITREPEYRRTRPGLMRWCFRRLLFAGLAPRVRARFLEPDERFNRTMDMLTVPGQSPANVRLSLIHPRDPGRVVGRTTTDKARLRDCVALAREDVEAWIAGQQAAASAAARPGAAAAVLAP